MLPRGRVRVGHAGEQLLALGGVHGERLERRAGRRVQHLGAALEQPDERNLYLHLFLICCSMTLYII